MIKIENVVAPSNEQWKSIILGARNPKNSWDRYDSKVEDNKFVIGPNDYVLLIRLSKSGTEHRKYMRGLPVSMDVTAPLYFWKEFDQHKIGMTTNSCSTMHKIHAKEFTLDDFSHEHLFKWPEEYDELSHFEPDISYDEENVPTVLKYASEKEMDWHYDHGAYVSVEDYDSEGNTWIDTKYALDVLTETIEALNFYRKKFLETKDKRYWWQMIQLLPSSYNQRRTVMLNYEVLAGIYPKRKDHKLDEWHDFCDWIKSLPYSEIITLEE